MLSVDPKRFILQKKLPACLQIKKNIRVTKLETKNTEIQLLTVIMTSLGPGA